MLQQTVWQYVAVLCWFNPFTPGGGAVQRGVRLDKSMSGVELQKYRAPPTIISCHGYCGTCVENAQSSVWGIFGGFFSSLLLGLQQQQFYLLE